MSRTLSWRGFWIASAILLAVEFLVDYHRYVMPDAVSTSVGRVVGYFLFAWIVWCLVKLTMKDRTPDARYFVLVLACVAAAASLLQRMNSGLNAG
jgi:hypothetical protein